MSQAAYRETAQRHPAQQHGLISRALAGLSTLVFGQPEISRVGPWLCLDSGSVWYAPELIGSDSDSDAGAGLGFSQTRVWELGPLIERDHTTGEWQMLAPRMESSCGNSLGHAPRACPALKEAYEGASIPN
jgi:hypothetical protein